MDVINAKGVNGQMTVNDDTVVITRKGALAFMTRGLKGDKTIPLDRISAVQMKNAGTLTNGYLQLTLSGGNESRGGLMDATKDENSVMFNKKQQPEFDAVKTAIEERRRAMRAPAAAAPDPMEQLAKAAELHKAGILTDEEFAAKKKQLLGL